MAVSRRQRIVVLGGGIGGVVAATSLGRQLGRDHDVTLIDRRPNHLYGPGLLSVMVGRRQLEDILRKLDGLRASHVGVVIGDVEGIDTSRQQVRLGDRSVGYDHLVISLGMEPCTEEIRGFDAGADHAWTIDAAVKLRQKLATFDEGHVVIGIPPGPFPCLPAAYGAAYLLHDFFVRLGTRGHIPIELFTRDPRPRGEDHESAVFMDQMARRRGITTHYSFATESIDAERKVVHGRFGLDLSYDLLFMVPPHAPSRALIDSRVADSVNGVRVDADTLETRWENVYAIGDCADVPAPRAVLVAFQEARLVAHNIGVKLLGRGDPRTLKLQSLISLSFSQERAAMSRTTYPVGWPPLGSRSARTLGPAPLGAWAKQAFEKWWFWRYF